MAQAAVAYVIVALAVAWVVWSTFVPRHVKQAVRRRFRRERSR